jgi:hypothetical protein
MSEIQHWSILYRTQHASQSIPQLEDEQEEERIHFRRLQREHETKMSILDELKRAKQPKPPPPAPTYDLGKAHPGFGFSTPSFTADLRGSATPTHF